jgi:hypothetical protein
MYMVVVTPASPPSLSFPSETFHPQQGQPPVLPAPMLASRPTGKLTRRRQNNGARPLNLASSLALEHPLVRGDQGEFFASNLDFFG